MVRRGFKIADAYVEIYSDDSAARRGIKELPATAGPDAERAGREVGIRIGKGLGPEADKQGRDAGNKLSQGIRLSVIRNSPLIAAAVAGVLIAGAPLLGAAAAVLFAGIGGAAASASVDVRSAWRQTFTDIKASAVEDASVLVPTYVRMAKDIGAGFASIRPQLRETFENIAPLVSVFTAGIVDLARNAMPGFVDITREAAPVVGGLANFLRDTGTGLSDFFSAISEHGPAAGEVWSQLGQTMRELLPLLGNVLGEGVELATSVLPLLNGSLHLLNVVLGIAGPLLGPVATGLAALKVAQVAGGWLGSLAGSATKMAQQLAFASYEVAGAGGRGAGGLSNALSTVSRGAQAAQTAMPVLGAVVAIAGGIMANASEQGQKWAEALREGGQAADDARLAMSDFGTAFAQTNEGWGGFLNALGGTSGQISATALAMKEARDANDEYWQSLTPTETATARLKIASADLEQVLGDSSSTTEDIARAQGRFQYATEASERAQGQLEEALHGVTSAMVEQADQVMASIDSGFAYRNSVNQLEDAQKALNDAIHEHGRGSEEAQRAQLALEEQSYRTAAAYGQQQADLSGLSQDSLEYKRIVQEEMLGELYRLRDAAGPQMAGAIQQQIDRLEAGGVALNENGAQVSALRQRMQDLGLTVKNDIPGQKAVIIDAPTADQKARLRDLGYTVLTLPNKQVIVSADTSSAYAALRSFIYSYAVKTIPILGRFIPGGATGGNVGKVARGFSGGGRLSGPGSPIDDLIAAVTASGDPLRLSNREYIIPGAPADMYGDRKLDSVRRGTALIIPDAAQAQAFAGGGRAGSMADTSGSIGATTVNATIQVFGTFDFTDPQSLRRAAEAILSEIKKLEGERR